MKIEEESEQMTWFTSDLHLNHRAAIKLCERPFDNIDEMNHTLIENINACVGQGDTLYILGDVANKGTVDGANALLSQIRCNNMILVDANEFKPVSLKHILRYMGLDEKEV